MRPPKPIQASKSVMTLPKLIRAIKSSMANYVSTAMVTLRVGKDLEKKDFMVHGSFLTKRSEFFRRALNGSWKEAETRIINLPDDEPEIVALYVNFVYTGQLSTAPEIGNKNNNNQDSIGLTKYEFLDYIHDAYDTLFSIFIFAEKIQDIKTKNAIVVAVLCLLKTKGPEDTLTVP
ncbi:BTB domain containing protein [Pyrenophora tritici-repentis]|nr:BTB domain containing protein [Pyrenophora tritici-repentis]KAI0582569.1 BTB domain-containing protein [Pyrenophora tritici-repentis]KAI0587813.1 BTB domain-containing protein [Pyrenophora tritici-repentis]KAI0609254.1 BTB domain-containing protein [Pyrenophora tritici-repentis]KAI0624325.1 BTB domain-containing protein [Pyrenophora tritici-repentis]